MFCSVRQESRVPLWPRGLDTMPEGVVSESRACASESGVWARSELEAGRRRRRGERAERSRGCSGHGLPLLRGRGLGWFWAVDWWVGIGDFLSDFGHALRTIPRCLLVLSPLGYQAEGGNARKPRAGLAATGH